MRYLEFIIERENSMRRHIFWWNISMDRVDQWLGDKRPYVGIRNWNTLAGKQRLDIKLSASSRW